MGIFYPRLFILRILRINVIRAKIAIMRFAKGEIYHVYIRGVEGRNIFLNKRDFERFLLGLKEFNTSRFVELRRIKEEADHVDPPVGKRMARKLASVLNYILMKNHIHLLVCCKDEKDLSRFLMKNFSGYTKYFNKKHKRRGVLFDGRSKSKHIKSEAQLDVAIKYVSLNGLDFDFPEWRSGNLKNIKGARNALLNYPWSGLQEILGRKEYDIIDKQLIKDFIPDSEAFLDLLLKWSSRDFEDNIDLFIEFGGST